MNSFKNSKCIQYLTRVPLSKFPLGRCSNSNLYLFRRYHLKHTRNFSTPSLSCSFIIKNQFNNNNNKSKLKRNVNDLFWHKFFYQKNSKIIKTHFRLENSCGILSIIPFHFSLSLVLLDDSDLRKSHFNDTTFKEMQKIKSTESPNLIKKISYHIWKFIFEYIIDPILISCRFIYLLCVFFPLIIGSPVILIGERIPEYHNERKGTIWWYNLLVKSMETAGPTFIKLAQWAASRTDIFPQEMCIRLSKLHSSVDPHPFHETKRIIEEAFNIPFEEIFINFDMNPIGIGAIAQVYKAIIRPEVLPSSFFQGDSDDDSTVRRLPVVAIKILHPTAEKHIQRDLKIMMVFAKIISSIPTMRWLSLPEEVAVFGRMMQDQLDLRIEATNLLEFQKNFLYRRTVSFPKPLIEYTTKNMLIEEYERGLNISLFLENGAGVFDTMIANLGLDAFLHMLIIDNFVHTDLHPGNIMIKFTKQNTYNILRQFWINYTSSDEQRAKIHYDDLESEIAIERLLSKRHDKTLWLNELKDLCNEGYLPQLIFLDTGLVTNLNAENRKNFLDLFRAIAEFDGYKAGKLMINRCKTPHLAIGGEIFALKMQHLVLNVKSKTLQLGKISISDILTQVLQMIRQHHVKLEGDFINVVISILLLEGIGRQLDPTMDLLKSALPILRELGAQGASKGGFVVKDIPGGNVSWLKFWFWLEAREWVDNASWNEYAAIFHENVRWPDI